jgi:hypothetical protein
MVYRRPYILDFIDSQFLASLFLWSIM